MIRHPWTSALIGAGLASLLSAACTPPDATRDERLTASYLALVAAEDARPRSGPDLAALTEAAGSDAVFLRRSAVRALGRLERPDLVPRIAGLLDDPAPSVRAEAANALAQAVHRAGGGAAFDLLIERAAVELDPTALASVARAIGRTAASPDERTRASAALLEIAGGSASPEVQTGVALGFESLVRRARDWTLDSEAAALLQGLTECRGRRGPDPTPDPEAARLRTLAVSVLGQAGRIGQALYDCALRDPDGGVRLAAARHFRGLPPVWKPEFLRRTLGSDAPPVALEGLLQSSAEPRTIQTCGYFLTGARSAPLLPLRLVSLDALAVACPQAEEQREALAEAADGLSDATEGPWRVATRGLVSLAVLFPEDARTRLPRFAAHPNPFVRAYAARAAAEAREGAALRRLAADPDPNVRTAAIQGLSALEGRGADDVLLAQLESDDPQLLLVTARLLAGSGLRSEATGAMLAALERISGAGRETWRDPRRALVERIGELGDASVADRLRPFLTDYDPVVAEDVAELLGAWTGASHEASPRPLPRAPLPTLSEYRALQGAAVALHMRGGDSIVVALDPWAATTNVFRFVRLAEEGYFDGLTFHRWAPNFVIQGGSPAANEYQGDGPYTRDEVGLEPHWRGTVGISTRGRDTGDAQIFVNLVDNVRLDHDYTIVGRVVAGMDAVDRVLEGAVIERAEVRRGG